MPVTICPIALVSSCTKCPIFKVCPVKGLIGDYRPDQDDGGAGAPTVKRSARKHAKRGASGKPKRRGAKRGKR